MRVIPLTLTQANTLVSTLHRHHKPVQGHRFSLGLVDGNRVVGAAVIGRPVARGCDPNMIAEVTRLVTDGTPNACSMLYGAAARACKAMGFTKIQTYILQSEPGTSLKATGWKPEKTTRGGSWNCTQRPRTDNHPTEPKVRWALDLNPPPTPA